MIVVNVTKWNVSSEIVEMLSIDVSFKTLEIFGSESNGTQLLGTRKIIGGGVVDCELDCLNKLNITEWMD